MTVYGRALTNRESSEKSEEIATLSQRIAERSDEIADLSQTNAELSARFTAYATGGDSYFYLHARNFGANNQAARITHVGENPVRDAEVAVFDITTQVPRILAGEAAHYNLAAVPIRVNHDVRVSHPQGGRSLSETPFVATPNSDFYAYLVYIDAANGRIAQLIEFVRTDGEWKQAYRVDRVIGPNELQQLTYHIDDGFPTDRLFISQPYSARL